MSPDKNSNSHSKANIPHEAADFIPNSTSASADSLSVQIDDPTERRYFRRALLIIGAAFLVMFFFFTVFFFFAVRGAERTVVPEILEEELVEALVMLQERELYPRVQVKYTGDPSDKGLVIGQDPEPGLYVKAGRRVTVTVSRGAIVDNVEDYVGKTITEVRGRLATFSGHVPARPRRGAAPRPSGAASARTGGGRGSRCGPAIDPGAGGAALRSGHRRSRADFARDSVRDAHSLGRSGSLSGSRPRRGQ